MSNEDRLAIRNLVDAYAYCADSRDADGQKALFTTDTHFVVYIQGEGSEPTDDHAAFGLAREVVDDKQQCRVVGNLCEPG